MTNGDGGPGPPTGEAARRPAPGVDKGGPEISLAGAAHPGPRARPPAASRQASNSAAMSTGYPIICHRLIQSPSAVPSRASRQSTCPVRARIQVMGVCRLPYCWVQDQAWLVQLLACGAAPTRAVPR